MLITYLWYCFAYRDCRLDWDKLLAFNGVDISEEIGKLVGLYMLFVCIAFVCPHTLEITQTV